MKLRQFLKRLTIYVSAVLVSLTFIASPLLVSAAGLPAGMEKDIKVTGIKEVDKLSVAQVAKEVNETQSSEVTAAGTLDNMLAKSYQMMLGGEPQLLTAADGTTRIGYSKGLLGETQGLMVALYQNPAASSQTYLADVLNSAGVAINQPAYAQGLGFSALNPILETWKIFRNIAFFFFVIVFIAIGFMIMFRQKISGQVVVTVEQAIPSIIVALLTVTFSYAIAGFLIDLMYVFMYLLVGIFGRTSTAFIDGNFIQLGFRLIIANTVSVAEAVSMYVNDSLGGGIFGNLGGIVSGLTAAVIFAIAIIIAVFKLFFNLLRRYVGIIISVALSPLVLMMGAIPGQNTFGPWVKSIIGNLMAFPTVLLGLIISDTITGTLSGQPNTIQSGGFLPPYLGGFGTGGTLIFVVGLGATLILDELVNKVCEATGGGKGPFDALGDAMLKNFGAGAPLGSRIAGTLGGGLLGAGIGEMIGRHQSQGITNPQDRAEALKRYRLRYAGNMANVGSGLGGAIGGSLGKTPGSLSFAEKGLSNITKGLTDTEVLRREGQVEGGLYDRVTQLGMMSDTEYRRQKAVRQADRERRIKLEAELAKGDLDEARKYSVVKD